MEKDVCLSVSGLIIRDIVAQKGERHGNCKCMKKVRKYAFAGMKPLDKQIV